MTQDITFEQKNKLNDEKVEEDESFLDKVSRKAKDLFD